MKITSSYDVKIKEYRNIFNETVDIYRAAVSFFVDVVSAEWDDISHLHFKAKNNRVERLTIKTASNPAPKYDFGCKFYKFPCYLRRAAIQTAIGAVSSYRSNYKNWEENAKPDKPPRLGDIYHKMPVFYKDNTFVRTGDDTARIKIYHRRDWVWLDIKLRQQDVKYIQTHCALSEEQCPTLKRKGKQWYLTFPFKDEVELSNKPIQKRRVCAVDLGINNDAVCSVMESDGTVTARKFISFPVEKDHLYKILGRIKRAQQHGARNTKGIWRHANNINTEISRKTAGAIMDFAKAYNVDVIVFEYLDMKGRIHGPNKQKLHIWRKREIQNIVMHQAHRAGMRVSRVCAWNTSKLAFDGTGDVTRDEKNYSMCAFRSGKTYHCDLNASYNIGARYFVRELLKSSAVMSRLPKRPKDGAYGTGSTRTLSTLIRLNADLSINCV